MKTEANATKETCSNSKPTVWWFVKSQRSHWIPTNADTGRKYDFDIPARRVSILKSSIHRAMDVSYAQGGVHIRHPVRSALVAAARVRRIKIKVRTFSYSRTKPEVVLPTIVTKRQLSAEPQAASECELPKP